MQQTTIQFETAANVQPIDVKAPLRKAVQVVNSRLDSRSEFYSRLLGQTITWRRALRIGVVLPALTVAVVACGVTAPLATAASLASAAWLVYRLNHEEKGGAL